MAVTLKDIARAMQVTTTSVHRALHGKPGVSEARRAEIQRAAAEMGYRTNYMAASLKRKDIRIAIAMPEPTFDNRYYYDNLWKGVRAFLKDVGEFSITPPLEYTYPLVQGANGAVLKEIYERHSDGLSGLLTMAVDHPQSSFFVEKLADKIPIVFVGSDMEKGKRFCCVKTYDEVAGSLAAELLTAFDCGTEHRRVIATGHFSQFGMRDQYHNVAGFEQYLRTHAPHIGTLRIPGEESAAVRAQLEEVLRSETDIFAIYSSSARNTILMSEVALALGLQGRIRLIGNDLFPESAKLLKQGVLTAIIDKKIPQQSYLAMKTLFDYVVKGEYPASSTLHVHPDVVLRSHVEHKADAPIHAANM